MAFSSPDPDFENKVRDSFSRQEFMKSLGARMTQVTPGKVEIHLPFRKTLTQQHGYFHAGATGAIADAACGYAAFSLSEPSCTVLTVEYKINLVAPAQGESLVARAEVLRSGKALKICRADVFAIKEGVEKLCATSLSTVMIVPDRSDRAGEGDASPKPDTSGPAA